jgi:hypothetical protein
MSTVNLTSRKKNMSFKTIMIVVDGDRTSQLYAGFCESSWGGFNLRRHSAVTPETLHLQSGIMFGKRGNRELTDTEKACFYSQYNLWKKCAEERFPILILEHDAWCERPNAIRFNHHLDVQFFGQHAMEAVMFHPRFANMLVNYCQNNPVTGPMSTVDKLLGYFNKDKQSRFGRPHARHQGPEAPVKSVIDPNLGTTVDHDGTTADRLAKDGDLFKIVNLTDY